MLIIRNLSVSFSKKTVFNNCNIEINKPQIFYLLGSNGSGKTTLLKCIAGIYRDFVGEIILDSTSSTSNQYEVVIKQQVSFLFSDHFFYPLLTVAENIKIFNHYLMQDEIPSDTFSLYHLFGLDKFKDVKANKLSDGNMQKLKICITFLKDANYYLLDEPIKNLDTESSLIFYDFIKNKYETQNSYFLIVSHNDPILEKLATQCLNLSS